MKLVDNITIGKCYMVYTTLDGEYRSYKGTAFMFEATGIDIRGYGEYLIHLFNIFYRSENLTMDHRVGGIAHDLLFNGRQVYEFTESETMSIALPMVI